jgi:uncharacterized protein (DUF2062 family)
VEIGWSIGVGAFVAFSPFVGLHLGLAFGLATLLRLNRLWTMIGSRMSFMPILLFSTFSEIEVGHRLLHGVWLDIAIDTILARTQELFVDWCVGTVLVGGPMAALLGLAAYAVARRAGTVTPRKREEPRPPSSVSPPSGPPEPTR